MKYIPASPLDIFQLKLGDTEQACRISVAVKLSGKIDEENLRQAADRAAAEQPVLTSRYRGDGHAGRFIAGTEPIPIPITDQHPDRVMTTLFPYHGALFEITVCRGTTDTIVFSAAHLLTDARGLITLAGRIAELFRCPQQKKSTGYDRTLAPAFQHFSAEKLQELFAKEHQRFPEILADKKYFVQETDPEAELTIVRETLSAETLARMKTVAKSFDATVHDLLIAAYGTALRDWLNEAAGVTLNHIPLCSTADLRRYFPEDRRDEPMNYTVAYWSPICCGQRIPETLAATAKMSQEIKEYAIGIGAAEPFTGRPLTTDDKFSGVPFLTNPGIIPSGQIDFGEDICVEDLDFLGVVAGGCPFLAEVWTYNTVLHLSTCTGGSQKNTAEFVLRRTAEILRGL